MPDGHRRAMLQVNATDELFGTHASTATREALKRLGASLDG
jgi:hypothetical protein